MSKENRLKKAKIEYAKGNFNHPHVLEFLEEIEKPEPKKKKVKKNG